MNFSNNAYSVLDGAIGAADTVIKVATGTGSRFPASDFLVTLIGYDEVGNESAWEILSCSSRSGDLLTVTRGQEFTPAAAWPTATRIENRVTAGSLSQFLQKTGGSLTGNLDFVGAGIRIRGDMSGATLNNRLMFQTIEENAVTELGVIPSGTGSEAYLTVSNKSDPSNASRFYMVAKATESRIESTKLGTGTYVPMTFYTNGTQKFSILADATGTIQIDGTAPRITGNFTNNTVANRVLFQTNVVNGATAITAIPNGAGTISLLQLSNNSAPANSSMVDLRVSATEVSLASSIFGTGSFLPMVFYTGGSERLRIDTSGNIGVGKAPVAGRGLLQVGGGIEVQGINGGQLAGHRNKIINGKMDIAQRGTSFAAAAGNYTLDRFVFSNLSDGVVTVSQQSDVPSSNEFQSSLRVAVTTADTSLAAGQVAGVAQNIEGYNARDLIGRTFTLSFWVRSSKTGTHCVGFRNSGNNRSYVSEYTVTAANTWEFKTLTVSGGLITAGTWDWMNGTGLSVFWTMAAGTAYQTTAGAWKTGDFLATSSQVNCLDTIGNIFAITGVQLEVGEVATPFEHRPIGVEFDMCRRYTKAYPTGSTIGSGLGTSATSAEAHSPDAMNMRATPTAQGTYTINARYADGNFPVSSFTSIINGGFAATHASNASATGRAVVLNVASGTLILAAEL